jgi:hypothetical protein
VNEEPRVRPGHLEVVRLERNRRHKITDVPLATRAATTIRQLDTDEQLGDGDGRHRHVVVISDHPIERDPMPLGVDQHRRVEDQSLQGRSSI